MKIGIVGLGLIGGSFAKAIKSYTTHTVYGADTDKKTLSRALSDGVIDGSDDKDIFPADIILVALYPDAAVEFLEQNAGKIGKSSIVIDCCGVKRKICEKARPLAKKHGFTFVGGHPMAGTEMSGYAASSERLFKGASMILTPDENVPADTIELLTGFFESLGFKDVTLCTPEEHDRMIAYTSQLAHIVSSAYVKSPAALRHVGFSAGSFKDMTRVAYLNEIMWSSLFVENAENLIAELDTLIANLCDYRAALENGDREKLRALLKDGKQRKIACGDAGEV
jgi:prephenate dehydrogenase